MAKMRAVAVAEPGGAFELVERDIPASTPSISPSARYS